MAAPLYLYTGPEFGEREDAIIEIKKSLKNINYKMSVIKGTYNCNNFFHFLVVFLILDKLTMF